MKIEKAILLTSLPILAAICVASAPVYAAGGLGVGLYGNVNGKASVDSSGTGVSAQGNIHAGARVESGSASSASGTVTSTASSTPNNEVGMEHRSAVANAVQELLSISGRVGGIGSEISVIAQAQNQNQTKIDSDVSAIQNSNGVVKFFIGPNYTAINDAQKLLSVNEQQIQVLEQLQTEVTSTTDQQQISNQINVLQQTNAQLNAYVQAQANTFSLFGWFVKLFAK